MQQQIIHLVSPTSEGGWGVRLAWGAGVTGSGFRGGFILPRFSLLHLGHILVSARNLCNKNILLALTGVAQWVGVVPQTQGTCVGCEPGPWLGACKRQLIHGSPPLLLLPPLKK